MLSGLMGMREGEQLLPFAKLFCGDPFPRISGKMRLVTSTTSTRERVESKETPSCPFSSASGNTEPCGIGSDCCRWVHVIFVDVELFVKIIARG